MKKLIIDSRMRQVEKEKLKSLGYELIEIKKSPDVYDEISAHPDIFCAVINHNEEDGIAAKTVIVEPSKYENTVLQCNSNAVITSAIITKGVLNIGDTYPEDIRYNICSFGRYVVHNFKYTDRKIMDLISEYNLEKIQVNQGYTNCSITVIDEKSIITEDKGIYDKLKNYDVDILLIEKETIYFPEKSEKVGFIGGTISRIGDNIIITGDAQKLKSYKAIKEFVENRNLKIIDFPGEELIDYGGIIEI